MQTSLILQADSSRAKLCMLLLLALILASGPLTLRYAAAHPDIADRMFAPVGEELLQNPLLPS